MGHPTTSTFASEWATMNHPDGPPPTTTEQPRGSVARRLQHAITHGNYNPDLLDTATLSFILCLLAPHYGKTAAIAPSHHHDKQQQRLTLYVKHRPDNTAPPGIDRPRLTDDGGLLSHTIEVS